MRRELAAMMRRIAFGIWWRRSRGQFLKGNCGVCEEPMLLWHQAPQSFFQQFCAQRLFDKEGCADCVGFLADLRIAGDHDYGDVNFLLPEDANEIRAAHGAHPMVGDKQVGPGFEDVRERILGVGKHGYAAVWIHALKQRI
jgi:hypothetical protein